MTTANYACLESWHKICRDALGTSVKTLELKSGGCFHYAELDSALFGRRIISLPFTDETTVLHGGNPDGTAEELASFLDEKAARTGAAFAELHGACPALETAGSLFLRSSPYIRVELNLSPGYKRLRAAYHRNIIKNLEQGGRRTEISRVDIPSAGELDAIYAVYLAQMARFGSPPLPRAYFHGMTQAGLYSFFTARVGGKLAGMLAVIADGGVLRADISASLGKYDNSFPKIRLFDESIRFAATSGFATYDFMRTRRGSGVHAHKLKWGGTGRDIIYYHKVYRRGAHLNPDPAGPFYRLASLGLRLLPAGMLERIGPGIRAAAGK